MDTDRLHPNGSEFGRPKALSSLLESYSTSHPLRSPSPLPPSSRVNPSIPQRLPPPSSSSPLLWTLPTWFAFLQFALAKGIHIIGSLIRHFMYGPARESWGYRMTFIVSFMRNVAQHTSLADIVLIRRLISFHSLIPLPADAVVTPITFIVPRQTGSDIARGFLREWDIKESGTRELSGEWVVGTDVWKRLKNERRSRHEEKRRHRRLSPHPTSHASELAVNGLGLIHGNPAAGRDSPVFDNDNESLGGKRDSAEKVIYYVHGGAYYVGNAATHRLVTIGVSKACNARVFAITYRLAPENVFPLPLHDVLHGYLRLLAPPLSIAPENIIIAGDSAGGGLSLALCMYLRDEGYKMPSGLILMSPWVDLTMSCGSWEDNADSDVVPIPDADDHLNPVGCYLGPDGILPYVTHPYASPLFGDLHDLPPMLIQSGDSEVLRDEDALLAHKATLAGVHVTHELYEDMIHVFQMFTWLPTAKAAIASVGRWVRSTLPRVEEERRSQGFDLNEGRRPSPMTTEAGGPLVQDAKMVDADGVEVSSPVDRKGRDRAADKDALHLSIPASDIAQQRPTIDTDSLPRNNSGSGSGSPTPTNSRSRSPALSTNAISPPGDVFQDPFHLQSRPSFLRRANTHQNISDTPISPYNTVASVRRRRPTVSAASMHASSPTASTHGMSNPVSPVPSVRRHLRSPSGSLAQTPRTRGRSESHSDIHHLIEGYVEGGAANETIVYSAGGDVISVGVLGESEEEDEG